MRASGITIVLLLMAALAPCGAKAAALKRAAGSTEIVIYNDDLALVREPYALDLARGRNDLSLEGVPRRIDSTSVALESTTWPSCASLTRWTSPEGETTFPSRACRAASTPRPWLWRGRDSESCA